jgi:hypothetical protein
MKQYGPFIVPSTYTTNTAIVIKMNIACPVVTSGTVNFSVIYADAPAPGTTTPTYWTTAYTTGSTTVSGVATHSVVGTATITPNVSSSPGVGAGDSLFFGIFLNADSNNCQPYLTGLYWNPFGATASANKYRQVPLGVCQGTCTQGTSAGAATTGNDIVGVTTTPYAIHGSTTTPQYSGPQFTAAGTIGTGQMKQYGPFTLPSDYTTNHSIVVKLLVACPTATTGTVSFNARYADASPTGSTTPAFAGTDYGTGNITVAGMAGNTAVGTLTISPTANAGDSFWFELYMATDTTPCNPYMTGLYWNPY